MSHGDEADYPTRRGVRLYPEDPFMEEIDTKIRCLTKKSMPVDVTDRATGHMLAESLVFREFKEIDSESFLKVFVRGVKAIRELTGSGTRVFEALYHVMRGKIEKKVIYMSYSNIDQSLTPMSSSTYKRGLAELIEKGFLAPTLHQGMYWVNHKYVWNGSRLAFVKEYCKREA